MSKIYWFFVILAVRQSESLFVLFRKANNRKANLINHICKAAIGLIITTGDNPGLLKHYDTDQPIL